MAAKAGVDIDVAKAIRNGMSAKDVKAAALDAIADRSASVPVITARPVQSAARPTMAGTRPSTIKIRSLNMADFIEGRHPAEFLISEANGLRSRDVVTVAGELILNQTR